MRGSDHLHILESLPLRCMMRGRLARRKLPTSSERSLNPDMVE